MLGLESVHFPERLQNANVISPRIGTRSLGSCLCVSDIPSLSVCFLIYQESALRLFMQTRILDSIITRPGPITRSLLTAGRVYDSALAAMA